MESVIVNTEVQLIWKSICEGAVSEEGQGLSNSYDILLMEIVQTYVTIRGFRYTNRIIEKYKLTKKEKLTEREKSQK
jgi:hypothetical protein